MNFNNSYFIIFHFKTLTIFMNFNHFRNSDCICRYYCYTFIVILLSFFLTNIWFRVGKCVFEKNFSNEIIVEKFFRKRAKQSFLE